MTNDVIDRAESYLAYAGALKKELMDLGWSFDEVNLNWHVRHWENEAGRLFESIADVIPREDD